MAIVIGVRFAKNSKIYYFDPSDVWPAIGDGVICDTARGLEYGVVAASAREVDDAMLQLPLRKVLSMATEEDVERVRANEELGREAMLKCKDKIAEHKLEMKLIDVEVAFDNSKMVFYFTANGRVDFRELVKDLASVFKTRIELRQIGVRDEAKLLGGLGPCGRPICCGAFLSNFQPVSIKMAKEQNLSLNPTKISGLCGRLMCCLKYEEEYYETMTRRLPRAGRDIMTPDGLGTVVDIDVLREKVKARIQLPDNTFDVRTYEYADCSRPEPGARAAQEAERAAEPEKPSRRARKGETDAERADKPEQPRRERRRKGGDEPATEAREESHLSRPERTEGDSADQLEPDIDAQIAQSMELLEVSNAGLDEDADLAEELRAERKLLDMAQQQRASEQVTELEVTALSADDVELVKLVEHEVEVMDIDEPDVDGAAVDEDDTDANEDGAAADEGDTAADEDAAATDEDGAAAGTDAADSDAYAADFDADTANADADGEDADEGNTDAAEDDTDPNADVTDAESVDSADDPTGAAPNAANDNADAGADEASTGDSEADPVERAGAAEQAQAETSEALGDAAAEMDAPSPKTKAEPKASDAGTGESDKLN